MLSLSVSTTTAKFAYELSRLVAAVGRVGSTARGLESVMRDNGFDCDLKAGRLDPKLKEFFAAQGVDVLGQIALILADNPWVEDVQIQSAEEVGPDLKAMEKLSAAYDAMTDVWQKGVSNLRRITPQPLPEVRASFGQMLQALAVGDGTYRFYLNGSIKTADGSRREMRELIHYPRISVKRASSDSAYVLPIQPPVTVFGDDQVGLDGSRPYVTVPNLDIAKGLRTMMKSMMEKAAQTDSEREGKRKVSKGSETK